MDVKCKICDRHIPRDKKFYCGEEFEHEDDRIYELRVTRCYSVTEEIDVKIAATTLENAKQLIREKYDDIEYIDEIKF